MRRIVSQNQGFGLTGQPDIGLCSRHGTGLVALAPIVQIRKEAEEEDKKGDTDSYLCQMLGGPMGKEQQ